MSQKLKAHAALLPIFVFTVLSLGSLSAHAFDFPWSKKTPSTSEKALDGFSAKEAEDFERQVEYRCAMIAAGRNHQPPAQTPSLQPIPEHDNEAPAGAEPMSSTEADILDALNLPFSTHRTASPMLTLTPAEQEKASMLGQRALSRAINDELERISLARAIDNKFVKAFIENGSFIPKYAEKDRSLMDRCRQALAIERPTRCSELYRELFSDTEKAHFNIVYSGKRLQDLLEQKAQTKTRRDISEPERSDLLSELEADFQELLLIRKNALATFGRNQQEYNYVRRYIEELTAELKKFIRQSQGLPEDAHVSVEMIEAFLKTKPSDAPAFIAFVNLQPENVHDDQIKESSVLETAWRVDQQLAQAFPESQRKEFVLKAIKGAKLTFPEKTQVKFRIIEKILAFNKVYENAKGALVENASPDFEEKNLHNFPQDHLRYIQKTIATFEVPEAFKKSLSEQITILLSRPTVDETKKLARDPKFQTFFEMIQAEQRLLTEKSGKETFNRICQNFFYKPVSQLIDSIPTNSERKAEIKDQLKNLMGFSKKLEYHWSFAGEIDALRSIRQSGEPKTQLAFLRHFNAKWGSNRGNQDDFLVAAASAIEFRRHWLKIKSYVRELATDSKSLDTKEEYTKFLARMEAATVKADKDGHFAITRAPTNGQIAQAVGGTATTIASLLATSVGVIKAIKIGVALTKFGIAFGTAVADNAIIWANQTWHLEKALPLLSDFLK